ncbi:MAG: DMT family transporter [Desulfosarcinaceae bacterium]
MGIGILFDFQLGGGLFGQLIALVGGAFAGLTVTLIKTLREKNGPVIIYLYFCIMGSLVTLPAWLQQPAVPASPVEWAMIVGLVLCSVTAQLLMNQGFFYCRGWEGGLFMSTEVVFTSAVGIIFLDDPVSWRFWTGGSIILACIMTMNWLQHRRRAMPAS